jgi:hypothetical protein
MRCLDFDCAYIERGDVFAHDWMNVFIHEMLFWTLQLYASIFSDNVQSIRYKVTGKSAG